MIDEGAVSLVLASVAPERDRVRRAQGRHLQPRERYGRPAARAVISRHLFYQVGRSGSG